MTPTAFIFAGINGAGKSTLYYDELMKNQYFGSRINTDEFVSSFGSWKDPSDQVRAAKIALNLRKNCILKRTDFNQETTLCGKSIINLFKELKDKKYAISLRYIGVNSPKIAKERVKARVAKGGHDIAESLIDKRFNESLDNLLRVIKFCDEIILFDNSNTQKQVIFEYQKGEKFDNKITPNNFWIYPKMDEMLEILNTKIHYLRFF